MKGKIFNSETGKWISGGAAQLHTIKKNGGWDNYRMKIAIRAAENAVEEMDREALKPRLKRVK